MISCMFIKKSLRALLDGEKHWLKLNKEHGKFANRTYSNQDVELVAMLMLLLQDTNILYDVGSE